MESLPLQQAFFNTIKLTMPAHISMVDSIAETLNISYDSVYRRIRGEKPLSMAEIKILCDHFHISLDQVLQLENDNVVFHAPGINNNHNVAFADYLSGILTQFKAFNSFDKRCMRYLCKDLPIWHFYSYPVIAAFKTFCWIKTIQNHPSLQNKKFSLAEFSYDECYSIGQQILVEYCKLPSIELWNFESLNSTTRQIEYYRDAELFANENDFYAVLDSLNQLIDHFQQQAEVGLKFLPGATELTYRESLQFYVNEVILGNNTIMVELNDKQLCFINYNVLEYLMTKDPRFNKKSIQSFNNLLSRSTIISGTGERFRNKFFHHLRNKVEELKMIPRVNGS